MTQSPHHPVPTGNLGPQETRSRFVGGVISLAIGIAVCAALVFTGLDRWFRAPLFIPFFAGVMGLLQARERT